MYRRVWNFSPGPGALPLPVLEQIRDEIVELTSELLVSDQAPTCPTPFSRWLEAESASVGRRYSSELARNVRGKAEPASA